MNQTPAPARPSASVAVVRDAAHSIEVLLLRRNDQIAFHGGAWVFPGGRVDDADTAASELDAARRAAAREAHEEAGLALPAEDLVPFAHWTTPIELPKRFATWFFLAGVEARTDIRIDDDEIVDYRWLSPEHALRLHAAGELSLPGPTFVTLLDFASAPSFAALAAQLAAAEVRRFVPRLAKLEGGRCAVYQEDAGYESLDLDAPGARHRLIMQGTDWRYVREL